MTAYIYGLKCPLTDEIRYVGKSVNPKARLRTHIRKAISGEYDHHNARWIRRLAKSGQTPSLIILHEVTDGEDWAVIERHFIAKLRMDGNDLTNSTVGGDGLSFVDGAHRDEVTERMRRSAVARTKTPDARAELSRRAKSAWENEDYRDAVSSGVRAANTPESRKVRSEKLKAAWGDPVTGEEMLSRFRSAEIRARRSELAKARWADPEFRAKMDAIFAGNKEKLSRAASIRWARARAAKAAEQNNSQAA